MLAPMALRGPARGAAPLLNAQGATPVAVNGGCLPPTPPPPPMAHGATPVAVSGGFPPVPPPAALGGFQPPKQNFRELTSPEGPAAPNPSSSSSPSARSSSQMAASCAARAKMYAGTWRPGPQSCSAACRKASGLLASIFSKTSEVMRLTVGFHEGSPPRSSAGSTCGMRFSATALNKLQMCSSFQYCSAAWIGCVLWELSSLTRCCTSVGNNCGNAAASTYFKTCEIS
mmetsp:Transcript_31902/g.91957  ORF Transcript_31902/g.91957 Transcript_31902/m.91957 type:complete len:229 (-) Transcript_31902:848-1534(-)